MYSLTFWAATAERAVATFAEVLLGFLTIGAIGFADVDWATSASVAGVSALASVLKSVVVAIGDGNPSAINAETIGYQGKHEA